MMLEHLLTQRKPAILKKWLNLLLDSYPPESSALFKKSKDRFANPVGHTTSQEMAAIFDELLKGTDFNQDPFSIDMLIKIRAVQDFSASEAVSFVFSLKKVIREELGEMIGEEGVQAEVLALESRIDDLALACFDNYMKSREKIYELKANEINERAYMLLKRANILCEIKGS